jgi:hypothetical protein
LCRIEQEAPRRNVQPGDKIDDRRKHSSNETGRLAAALVLDLEKVARLSQIDGGLGG